MEKWITDAAENEFYKTRAESDGFVFLSTISISESSGGITLTSSHDSKPQGIVAKLISIPMGVLFKGVAKKALLQDLNDIKSAVEQECSIAVQQRHAADALRAPLMPSVRRRMATIRVGSIRTIR